MRAFIISICLMLLLASSCFAKGYPVKEVHSYSTNGVLLWLDNNGSALKVFTIKDAEFQKQVLAIAMMAKAQGLNVEVGGWAQGRFGTIKLVNPTD